MTDPLLDSILSPLDLKNLTIDELNQLSAEIRQRIIDVMSVNGGHLASNLGAVELTIALHKVFNSPQDKFIWDVSHQTYTHKILTGRNDRFDSIRQFKGLNGFSHPKESPYDHFYAGHAGTAISLGLGVATTRDLVDEQNYVIPIIGDATLTCGLSLEALNNIPKDLKKFIVILNDNAMSISQNVGAITRILSRLLCNPTSEKIFQELDSLVSKIPSYGQTLAKHGHRITESVKHLVSPAAFFEHYGLSYMGPIDGHNIADLITVFEEIKDAKRPIILHVLTNKGQGMAEAIKNPVSYHGAKPFSKETGKFLPTPSSKPTFPKIFGSHILEMAKKDPSIVAVTPAMSAGSCLDDFMQAYPKRCLDVGIAESHAITFAGGLGYQGKIKVFASIYATFLHRALDNVFHDVCLQEIPVVFAIDRGGISGPDGATHHGIYDISFLNAMPNMVICQPRNGQLLCELMESAHSYNKPVAIRYPNMSTELPQTSLLNRPIGKGELLREGKDILIISLGVMSYTGLELAKLLEDEGFNPSVFDPIFVKPLDQEAIVDLLMTHKTIITIEEHSLVSGLGSIINNFLMTNGFCGVQVMNFGIPESYIDQGSHKDLLNEIGLTSPQIFKRVMQQLKPIEV